MQVKLANFSGSTVRVQLLRDAPVVAFDYQIDSAADVERLVGEELRQYDREHLLVIYLTSRCKVIAIEVVAIGSLAEMIVSPREVFKGAILANAHEIVLVHNHPSGDVTPSPADIMMTKEIAETGRMLKIPVQDHVIIGNGYFSFYESTHSWGEGRGA